MTPKSLFAFVGLFAMILGLSVSDGIAANIKPEDVAGAPAKFCKVIKEPDPLLMGGWAATWARYRPKKHDHDVNPVEFWLVKRDNRYALFFYRFKTEEQKTYVGWKDWTINGHEITSDTGVRFFTEGGEVFFQWQNDKPVKMTRIQGGP